MIFGEQSAGAPGLYCGHALDERAPYNDEVHFALAGAYAALGDTREVQHELQLALENSTSRHQFDLYAGKLSRMNALLSHGPTTATAN